MRRTELDALIARFGRNATLEYVASTLAREASEAAHAPPPRALADSDRPGSWGAGRGPIPAVEVVRKGSEVG